MDFDVRVNLKSAIRDRCVSQAALAREAGMAPSKLSQVLTLQRKLDANEMFALCKAMKITANELAEYQCRYEPRIPV